MHAHAGSANRSLRPRCGGGGGRRPCKGGGVFHVLGSVVDALHALVMVAWVAALPLLFYHRWPRLTRFASVYALVFVVVSQGSQWLLGECFLTTVARWLWQHEGGGLSSPDEWFTVRFAQAVFRMTPSHDAIVWASEALAVVTAAGVLSTWARRRRGQPGRPTASCRPS